MSVVSDVRDLYGSLESTWSRSQAHIFSHAVAGVAIFLWCGVTFPAITIPQFDADHIIQEPWFKLAQETGLIYVALVIPVIVLSAYTAFLEIIGRFFVTLFTLVLHTSRPILFDGLSEFDLEPLALIRNKDDEFRLNSLIDQLPVLVIKYQSSKSDIWSGFQKSLAAVSQNSTNYLGDFSVLLLFWVCAFLVWRHTGWAAENANHFWSVTMILLVLILLSWLRVSRAMSILPRLTIRCVASLVRVDPEYAALFQTADDRRHHIWERLNSLLNEERDRERRRVSFLRLIWRWSAIFPEKGTHIARDSLDRTVGFYERGRQVSEYGLMLSKPPSLTDIIAYLYYCGLNRISMVAHTVWRLLCYIVTGSP